MRAVAVHVALVGPLPTWRGSLAGAHLARGARARHLIPVGSEAAAHLVADAGRTRRCPVRRRHAREPSGAAAVEVAVRAACAALLPLMRAVAVHVALVGPLPTWRGSLAGAHLARGARARHLIPVGSEAAAHLVADAGRTRR